MVKPYEPNIIKQLQQLWGNPQEFSTTSCGGAIRTRDFHTYPPITQNIPLTKSTNNPICKKCHTTTYQLPQGWFWPTPQQHHLKQPSTIKAITPRLYDNHHKSSHTRLHESEKQQLKQLQIFHPDKKAIQFLTRITSSNGWEWRIHITIL